MAIFLFVLVFAAGAAKPLHLDDIEFARGAERTAHTGIPVYYHGETIPRMPGLYHPPLYMYVLAAWMRLFGEGAAQIRLLGLTCAIWHGLVVLAIVRTIFGPATAWRWMPWFWIVFLLNPFTLQTASISDIDSSIYGPLLCAALLAVLRLSWRDGEWRTDRIARWEYGLIAASLMLCLWATLTTVLLILPFVFLLMIARLGVKRAAMASSTTVAAAVAGFLASYWLYGKVTGLNIGFTFDFLWESFTRRGALGTTGLAAGLQARWQNFTGMVPFMIRWIG